MWWSWSEYSFPRWPELDLSVFRSWSGYRPDFRWWPELGFGGMDLTWAQLDFSFLDQILWSLITAVESVALVSMLCFFLLFCGCKI